MILRAVERQAEVPGLGVGADPPFEVERRRRLRGNAAAGRGALAHQQRVRHAAPVQLPLQVAQPHVADQRLALVGRQLEAAGALVLEHGDDAQPHALQLVLRVLLPHQAGPRRLAGPLQVEHDGVAGFDRERFRQRAVDGQGREELALAAGKVERFLRVREERGEPVVDPLHVDAGGAAAALGFHHAALHEDRGRHRAEAGGELPVAGQFVPQILAEETGPEQGVVDAAEPVQGQVAQAAANGVAHHQRAGQHGGRDRRGQHDGDVRAPVVAQAGQGSAGMRGSHGVSPRPPVAASGGTGSAGIRRNERQPRPQSPAAGRGPGAGAASPSWPARNSTRRGNRAASSRLCVTTIRALSSSPWSSSSRSATGARRLRVQVARRLVAQEQARPVDHRPHDRGPLPLAARQLRRPVIDAGAEAYPLQQGARPLFRVALVPAVAGRHRRQQHVLEHRVLRQQVVILEHEAHAPAPEGRQFPFRQVVSRLAADANAARGRRLQRRGEVQQRALAAAGRSGDGHRLARFEGERDPAQHLDGAPLPVS